MPLHPGKSKQIISTNIKEMEATGHKPDQAVAAALHNAYDKAKSQHTKTKAILRKREAKKD